MKYSYFLVLSILIGFVSSCCDDYDAGDSIYRKTVLLYSRKIKLLDTSDRITRISYKDSEKIFYPNDTITELIISENKENTLYIHTKTKVDTIVLMVKIIYGMSSNSCKATNTGKYVEHLPFIVNNTFDSAYFKAESTNKTYTDMLFIKP